MPSRLLREGILDSEAVNSLSPEAEVFYRRLMSIVDDFGRFDGRLAVLRSRLYALQLEKVREASLVRWIAECEKANLIRLYTHAGKPYITFLKLGEPRAKLSKYPPPPGNTHPFTDVNGCEPTGTDVPYSFSDASSNSDASKTAPPKAAADSKPPVLIVMPKELDTPEFRSAWDRWKADRRARKIKAYTADGEQTQLKKLATFGLAPSLAAIENSIANQWQGIFPKEPGNRNSGFQTHDERVLTEMGLK